MWTAAGALFAYACHTYAKWRILIQQKLKLDLAYKQGCTFHFIIFILHKLGKIVEYGNTFMDVLYLDNVTWPILNWLLQIHYVSY